MSLVFSAIAPNSPLLIPSVGKEDLKYAQKTLDALKTLEENLYAARPQTIVILSGHKKILNSSFAINLTPRYKSSFKNFGDFSESKEYFCDIEMCHHIREVMEGRIPVKLYSDEELDYEISAPLFRLAQNLKNFSIVPISFSALDNASHFNFGENLKEIIFEDTKRIAVIASGDFSSRKIGGELDTELIKNLKEKNIKKIIRKSRDEILGAEAENGYLSLLILLGIIEDTNYTQEILSYEFPFDIGLLVANFKLY